MEKDTKTHQMRRIALDNESVVLLTEHKAACVRRLAELDMTFEWVCLWRSAGGTVRV